MKIPMNLVLILFMLVFTNIVSLAQTSTDRSDSNFRIFEAFIPHPDAPSERVQIKYVYSKFISGRLPLVVFQHGSQGLGVETVLGSMKKIAAHGYLVGGISSPGFGSSDGTPDWNGPHTLQAVLAGIQFLKHLSIRDLRIPPLLAGRSRGGQLIYQLLSEPSLGKVLGAVTFGGPCHFPDFYVWCSSHLPTLAQYIEQELGKGSPTTEEALFARNPDPANMPPKVWILAAHGMDDNIVPHDSQTLACAADWAQDFGIKIKVSIVPGVAHRFTEAAEAQYVVDFLRERSRSPL